MNLILRIKEIWCFIQLVITYCLSLFYKERNLWLISERGQEARDNGYFFFRYLKEKHPDINVKYVISRASLDIEKLRVWNDSCVGYGSYFHFIYFWKATHLISTHPMGCSPIEYLSFMTKLHTKFKIFRNKKHIFLQHGITKDNLPGLYKENIQLDLFICGAKPEYDYVRSNFHYHGDEVRYTGFCRYDNLNQFSEKNQILIMPTWRKYIDRTKFDQTDYFKYFRDLLQSKEFHQLLEEHNLKAIFYPHYAFQQCIKSFKQLNLPKTITIADFHYDVQTLLKESKLLISDYSSVYFDMAYMHKPILLYQFDEQEYRSKHYKEGYFNVTTFCEKYSTFEQLMFGLKNVILRNFTMKNNHLINADSFFVYRDNCNCDRVFGAILSLDSKC